jgi:mannitol/fructose-specific phosphotransferase system IIA component (Ntr-type)
MTLGASVETKEEAIRLAGMLLYDDGKVELGYVEAMLKLSQELGAYVVIAPGFALPHARPESGVKQAAFSVVTIPDGVRFGSKSNDPVRVVMALAAVDSQSHLKALSELSKFLQEDGSIEAIANCRTEREVVEAFQAFEKRNG